MSSSNKTMVVKIGSSTLVGSGRHIRRGFLHDMATQAHELRQAGWNLVVVSSGAVA